MALRPRTVKAGSLAAIAVPSVLGSTLVAPASAFAPVVQDIPGAATATQAPKPLFTSTVQPTLSQVSVQIRQQAEQAKQTQQAPATTAVQPIQKPTLLRATQQHSRRLPRLPSSPHRLFRLPRRLSLPLSPPWHRLHRPPQLPRMLQPPPLSPRRAHRLPRQHPVWRATRTNQIFPVPHFPGWYHLAVPRLR